MRMTKRNRELLTHTFEYQGIWAQIVKDRFIPTASINTAVTWLRRLRERNLLVSERLYEKRTYYRITGKAARILRKEGIRVRGNAHLRPSRSAKRMAFAVNVYCAEPGCLTRKPYKPRYDAAAFPRIARMGHDPLRHKQFVRDGDTITLFLVDTGTQQLINENVIPKISTLLDPEKFPEFVGLFHEELFQFVIATATEPRADELLSRLEDNPPPLPSEVIVIPELIHFLPNPVLV